MCLKDVATGLFCNIFVPNEYTKERECQTLHVRKDIPRIYIVTPTHTRLTQKADLTRLSYTLRLVPNIRWIVVEDADQPSDIVKNLLANSELHYTHLFAKTRTESLKKAARRNHRGVNQRNEAISWIRRNAQHPGVVYFADDDNTYAIRVFEEMRYTKKISVWPVGLVAGIRYESPKVRNGKASP
ncbi:B3GA3-like protein [Mya arenaria]|uniref:Galactosylgalactosylxylosylprotein 3-beta-glucuronosyltransferase n=1 Tax=Mya arenaria TaxID=6604 RepID=A0ABY7FDV7_MYAAR|nr:B3GA3-like protein [Mya arenaria]